MDFYYNNIEKENNETINNFKKRYSYNIDHKKALENVKKSKQHKNVTNIDKTL